MDRKQYKEIKRYSREELEEFLRGLYGKGFQEGVEVGQEVDFKVRLVSVLSKTKGVGDKTIKKVLATLEEVKNE